MQTKVPTQQAQQNHTEPKSAKPAQAQFEDARPEASTQLRMQSMMADSAQTSQLKSTQAMMAAKPNNTGLPNQLKAGIENLSGMSMDHVRVHYNSDKPAQLQAYAYAQGSEIHVAPGQEKHVPHEAWHVVQQAQGRVKPTMQMKDAVPVNDDAGLEHEADVMGEKALQMVPNDKAAPVSNLMQLGNGVAQCATSEEKKALMKKWEKIENDLDEIHVEFEGKNLTTKIAAQLEDIRTDLGRDAAEINKSNLEKKMRVVIDWIEGTNIPYADEAYYYLEPFTVALPKPLDGLALNWVKKPQYYTENGWMSENLHLDARSSAALGSESLLSIHSIIAIKEVGSIVRINPHVTVRDQGRQRARDERETRYIEESVGHGSVKKSPSDRNEDRQDAQYSKQVGLKSTRDEKNGQESGITTIDLEGIFTEAWLRGIVGRVISKADTRLKRYEVGTSTHKFIFDDER